MSKGKIIILGGTGFLGFYTTKLALERGYEVDSLSLNDVPQEYPKEVKTTYIDIFKASEEKMVSLLTGYDYMIYALGPDDRCPPVGPANKFFNDLLVDNTIKVFKAAEKAGIKKSVLFGSIFTYFVRRYPDIQLVDKHIYAECRVKQAVAVNKIKEKMEVVTLEIPYVFGFLPGKIPAWKSVFLDKYMNGKKYVFFAKGGTTMISVEHIAEAAIGAIEYGKDGELYPLGDESHTFKWMLQTMAKYASKNEKKILCPETWMCVFGAKMYEKEKKEKGLESGIDYVEFMRNVLSKKLFIDDADIKRVCETLHMTRGGLEESIKETMEKCYPGQSME